MQVKINSYVTEQELTEEQAIENALKIVKAYDTINENRLGEEVVTKLYYIVPLLGKILVAVNDTDREILGVESNILANTNISEYPIEKLPSNVIEYKELIIKKDSSLTAEQILNAGQSIAEEAARKTMPYKIPIVKVINYNTNEQSHLVMSSIFGDNIFNSISGIVNMGDAEAGIVILNNNMPAGLGIEESLSAVLSSYSFPSSYAGDDNFSKNWSKAINYTSGEKVSPEVWEKMVDNIKVGVVVYSNTFGYAFISKEKLFRDGICKKLSRNINDSLLWHIEDNGCSMSGRDYSLLRLSSGTRQYTEQRASKGRFDLCAGKATGTGEIYWDGNVFLAVK